MSLVLNTNIASLNAQNNLSGSQAQLNQSLERLSSGLRINSAADDAAGLAISQQFTTQINGTNQAVSNANDAVSEAQTTAGALNTIVNNLQSIRTLAVESANGSNSASDRQALNNQVQQQIAEITQIAQQTTFNGLNVLNGSSGTTVYQVGANVGNTIAVSLQQGVGANQIGQFSTATGGTVTGAALTGTSTVTASDGTSTVTVGATSGFVGSTTFQGATSAFAKAAAINGAGLQGLTASAATTAVDTVAFGAIGSDAVANTAPTTASTFDLTINGTAIFSGTNNVPTTAGATGGLTASAVVSQINLFTGTTGVTASLNTNASVGTVGAIILSNTDGSDISVGQTVTEGTGATAGGGFGAIAGTLPATVTTQGKVTLTDSKPVTLTDVGTAGGSVALGFVSGQATGLSLTTSGATATLANQNVLTVAGANSTISSVDAALSTVSAFQSQLGAIQNRFTAAVSNLQSTAQNLTQSRSTIQDADFAAETANLTQAQVLEQAGISVLAQANQQPQLILKLLQ
ncbi:MAG TPA: flagellin [Steroidobacteraceae bacterium]|jgi:flagellin|nr:flagellin [Steroidobacteraceae bacterium]